MEKVRALGKLERENSERKECTSLHKHTPTRQLVQITTNTYTDTHPPTVCVSARVRSCVHSQPKSLLLATPPRIQTNPDRHIRTQTHERTQRDATSLETPSRNTEPRPKTEHRPRKPSRMRAVCRLSVAPENRTRFLTAIPLLNMHLPGDLVAYSSCTSVAIDSLY